MFAIQYSIIHIAAVVLNLGIGLSISMFEDVSHVQIVCRIHCLPAPFHRPLQCIQPF